MTAHELKTLALTETTLISEKEEEFSIPLDISDIISICREYNKLGWQIQQQVGNILEVGVEESIKSGIVKREALPHVKSFLTAIYGNAYFGDAAQQAQDCIMLIKEYEHKYQEVTSLSVN